MPPVDITRRYTFGYEHVDLQVVTTVVEKIVERTVSGNHVRETTSVIIRDQGGALAPVTGGKRKKGHCHCHNHRNKHSHQKMRPSMGRPRYFRLGSSKRCRRCHCSHHHRRRHGDKKHHHHRHRKDSDPDSGADPAPLPSPGPDELSSSYIGRSTMHHADHRYGNHQQLPFTGLYNSEMASRLADFALGELGFLALSFVLSLVLLFVGYRVGECVCKFESSRNRSRGRGRGHKSSLARRHICRGTQTAAAGTNAPPQPIYLEEEEEEDVGASNDMVCVSESGALLNVAKPNAARTKGQ